MTVSLGLKVDSRERHERFLLRALQNGSVWYLGCEEEDRFFWAQSTSNGDQNGKGAGKEIVPLWSDRAYAKQCAKGGWAGYEAYEIALESLLESVLPNMHRAKVRVGTNWNAQLVGFETTPNSLRLQLQTALKRRAANSG